MSALAIRLIESTARKLEREGRIRRNQAETHPNETIRHMLLRQSWSLRSAARKILEEIGSL